MPHNAAVRQYHGHWNSKTSIKAVCSPTLLHITAHPHTTPHHKPHTITPLTCALVQFLEHELGIQKVEDCYSVTTSCIIAKGGAGLLDRYHGSVTKILEKAYPQYYSTHSRTHTPTNFVHELIDNVTVTVGRAGSLKKFQRAFGVPLTT